jgi:Tfp pilus assembly protein PilX
MPILHTVRDRVLAVKKRVFPRRRGKRTDRGVALVVSLLLLLALSAIGASLLMLSNTETYASMNYRMMSQARYGAEAGVLKAVNHFMNTYAKPGLVGTDPLSNYNTTVSPVTYNGQPVVLSAVSTVNSNYPYPPTQTAFNAAVQGNLAAGQTVSYGAYATLVSMRTVVEYAQTAPTIIQTWHITGVGTLGGTRPAAVEVTSVLERNLGSAHSFGVFATQVTCASVDFGGGSTNDSYDSSAMTWANGVPVTQPSGGKVGTNGNLTVNGNAAVYGTLSTPRVGVGKCKDGAIVALTQTAQAQVTGGLIQLPQSIIFPTPAAPSPMPPTTNVNLGQTDCASMGLTAPTCTGGPGNMTIDAQGNTMLFGNVSVSAGDIVHLKAGVYNLNSITLGGGAQIIVDTGPVVLNVAGAGTNAPISMQAGIIANPTFNPANLRILYAGTSPVTVAGGAASAAILYAPNAPITVSGGSDFYGSIVGSIVSDTGGTHFHYDRALADDFFIVGNYIMSSFTWKKY